MQTIGRPRLAIAYTWITALLTLVVFVQGFLFGAFYSERNRDFIDIHGLEGEFSGFIIVVVLIPLALAARFPRELRMGWWTVAWAVLWNLQAHVFGYGIEDVRWFAMIHVPLALFLLAMGLHLASRAHRGIKESGTVQPKER